MHLEGWPHTPAPAAHPSRLTVKNGEHLRMTAVCVAYAYACPAAVLPSAACAAASRAIGTR